VNIRSAVLQLLKRTDRYSEIWEPFATSYQMVKKDIAPWSYQPRGMKEGNFFFVFQNMKNLALFFTNKENKFIPFSAKQDPTQILWAMPWGLHCIKIMTFSHILGH
jgi:hypothetical protein